MTELQRSSFARQSNVTVSGQGTRTLLCAHGFCSNQKVFDYQRRAFEGRSQLVSYDLAGCSAADPALWDPQRHNRLEGYAEDMVRLIDELDLRRIVLLGASMSSMIGLMASLQRPERFEALVLIGASPRYLNDPPYLGGFEQSQLDAFYALISQQRQWADAVFNMMLNQPVTLALQEVAEAVYAVDPEVARVMARAIFQSDYRALLPQIRHPVLVVQTRADSAVPVGVGQYLQQNLPDAELALLPGVGHLPNFTNPETFNEVLAAFLHRLDSQPTQRRTNHRTWS